MPERAPVAVSVRDSPVASTERVNEIMSKNKILRQRAQYDQLMSELKRHRSRSILVVDHGGSSNDIDRFLVDSCVKLTLAHWALEELELKYLQL